MRGHDEMTDHHDMTDHHHEMRDHHQMRDHGEMREHHQWYRRMMVVIDVIDVVNLDIGLEIVH